MESVAHSRQPNKVPVTVSKKITTGSGNGGFSGKTLYDDVYGGAPKFASGNSLSPRFEDYGEIFASFHAPRASSIPVLDLPAVDGGEVFFNFQNAGFDYAEVFGGLDSLDFWLSYEDLFRHGVSEEEEEEEEEAWTPVETDSLSGDVDHFGDNQDLLNGDHFRSVDESTEFNISYHKVNGTSNENVSKGKNHISQLHVVPGFTHVFDESAHFHRTDPSLQVVDDVDLDMEFNASQAKRNHLRKTMSHLSNFTSGEQVLDSDLDLHDVCSRNGSRSSEMFVTVSDISLRTLPSQVPPPSRLPPVLDAKKGHTSGFYSNNEWVDPEETLADSSLPFFDVKVDMNSSSAVMKEVMHRPEAKLRSAKELNERKKRVSENNVKFNEATMSVNLNRFNSLNDGEMLTTSDQRTGKMKISVTDERHKARKAAPETQELLEREKLLNMSEEKHIKESRSSEESDRSTEVGTWKGANEFFELVGTEESGKVIQPINRSHSKSLVHDTRIHECDKKEREAASMQEEYKKVKANVEGYQLEERKKKSKPGNGAYEQGKNIRRSKSSNEECRQREHVKNNEMTETFELQKREKTRMVQPHGKTEMKETKADQSRSLKEISDTQHKELKRMEGEKSKEVDRQKLSEVQWSMKHMENEKKLRELEEQQLSTKMLKQSQKMKENGNFQREAFVPGAAEGEQRVKDSVKLETFEKSNEITFEQGKEKTFENEEIEESVKAYFKMEESDEGSKHTLEQVENEKGHEEVFKLEMNEEKTQVAFELGENEACERDQYKEIFREFCDGYRKQNRLEGVGDTIGVQKVLEQALELEMNSGNKAQRKKGIESPSEQAFDREGSVNISNEDSHSKQPERILKDTDKNEKDKGLDKALEQIESSGEGINVNFAKETNETWKTENGENLLAAHSSSIYEENIGKPQVCKETIADLEIEKTGTECKVGEKKLEDIWVENLMDNGDKRASEMAQGEVKHSGTHSRKVVYTASNASELSFSSEQTCTEKTKTVPRMGCDHQTQERKISQELGEKGNTKHVNVALNPEEIRDQMSSSQANLCGDYRKNTVVNEPATVQEAVNIQKTFQRAHVAHSTKSKEKILNETYASVEKDAERIRREKELEKDRLRKIEEEMEREKERLKDRMAVDQRAMAEARERLEKACAEAKDKTYGDKAAAEARLKAERIAVERATAEARERAMEKVKIERAAFESRDRLERSVSDKFSVSFRNDGRQGSSSSDMLDSHFQSSSTHSKYPYSSIYGASSFSERSEQEGESAQRCRARLERYRRTAERVAKALEEKNVRDLVAQKEQAERNRLAETLDTEVKRWSSGKEGNLRALLSTLQYILGPDNGWQPIPLTEVITSAAVKKAYRKATLCVHPDKLQQRGASIQHKYICEKVFDLLKEAWNKFNSEER
ncbi:auxilin-like protein 1 [Abrus precatorius]|uniref:Auxilin-like protein 1 n=1 Tax=Abrus precatorius TaxID=3816 RepID=A0A8B8KPL3_ABRPR|nr:auxilin-like protein 1 [Abrus precatorius]